jgi:hypothetical protein
MTARQQRHVKQNMNMLTWCMYGPVGHSKNIRCLVRYESCTNVMKRGHAVDIFLPVTTDT